MNIEISAALLKDLLSEIEDSARIVHSRFDRKTRTYVWNDKVWKAADPYRFAMVKKAFRLLPKMP